MGKGGKSPKIPPAAPPPPVPVVSSEVGDNTIKNAKRASNYEKTIITGELVPKNMGKKTLLG